MIVELVYFIIYQKCGIRFSLEIIDNCLQYFFLLLPRNWSIFICKLCLCFGSFVAEKKVNHNFVEVLAHASFVTVSNSISLEIWKQYSKYLIILEAFINSSFIRIRISSFIHRINKFTAPYKNIKWSYLEN